MTKSTNAPNVRPLRFYIIKIPCIFPCRKYNPGFNNKRNSNRNRALICFPLGACTLSSRTRFMFQVSHYNTNLPECSLSSFIPLNSLMPSTNIQASPVMRRKWPETLILYSLLCSAYIDQYVSTQAEIVFPHSHALYMIYGGTFACSF